MDKPENIAADAQSAFRSQRLIYREIQDTEADKNWFHNHIQNDPVSYALSDPSVLRPQVQSRSNEALLDMQKSMLGVMICISPAPAEEGKEVAPTPVGVLSLSASADGESYRAHHRVCSLSIVIAAEHQNKGYGAEAIDWALDWAFTKANIHSVGLSCVEFNTRAAHLYEKLGFVLEGRLRSIHFYGRRWWDVLLYSMLEDEWESLRGWKGSLAAPARR
ncbi:acyl-CoA N-acyltransferase [Xylariales sp. PMI_506]|nr:acyl-CoA N-acyltransferase [Xylariales sp. PMI_506]